MNCLNKKGGFMSERDTARKEVLRVWRSCASSKEKGEAMCAYFRKYVTPAAKIEPCKINLNEIFDGALPLQVCA